VLDLLDGNIVELVAARIHLKDPRPSE
jgi:hypothetical protein